ncbi:hypothetical protein QD357_26555 [Rhizobium sp. BR 317]
MGDIIARAYAALPLRFLPLTPELTVTYCLMGRLMLSMRPLMYFFAT